MTYLDRLSDLFKEAMAAEYARGYEDACRDIQEAATRIRPKHSPAASTASRSHISDVGSARDDARDTARAARGARDDAVVSVLRQNAAGLTQADIQSRLRDVGDDAPRSSLNVVMKRLLDEGRVIRSGRVFTVSSVKGPDQSLEAWADPFTEANQEEDDHAAALVD